MSYNQLSSSILEQVGGVKNVSSLTHCATRLRFVLKSDELVNQDALNANPDILGVVSKGGQLQVVLGTHVNQVCNLILSIMSAGSSSEKALSAVNEEKDNSEKKSMTDKVFGFISGSFSPLLPVIAGTGMLKAILAILVYSQSIDQESATYIYLNSLSNSVIYFMPIFLGITAALKVGSNPYVAAAIGATLVEPGFISLIKESTNGLDILGLSIVPLEYSSSVFPILFAVLLQKYVEKYLDKVTPKSISLFFVPLTTLVVITTIVLFAFGPFGTYLSHSIADVITFLSAKSGLIAGAVLGAGITYMVLFGLHWGLIPIIMSNIITTGSDITVGMTVSAIYAQVGLALACYFKTKKSSTKALSISASLTGLLAGVTEPILYGLVLKNKKLVGIIALAGGIGGAINGMSQVQINGFALQGVFSFSLFSPFVPFIIGISTALIISFVLTLFVYEDSK